MAAEELKQINQPWRNYAANGIPYVVSGLILILLPPFLPVYLQSIMTKFLVLAIFAMSLNILFGFAGLFSLGHAAFFGTAGYVTAILSVHYGIESLCVTLPVGVFVASLVAALFGLIALRVSGIYFLLVTFALGQLLYSAAIKWRSMTGGYYGLAGIELPAASVFSFTWNTGNFYYFVFLTFALCYFLIYRFLRSPFGYALLGIREDESRMRALGYNTWLYKYFTFIVAGMFAGVSGTLFAYFNGLMAPEHLGFQTSGLAMFMVIMGGAGTLYGPIVGCMVTVFLQFSASLYTPVRWPLILGGAFILVVMYLRGGISLHMNRFWGKVWSPS